MSRESFVLLLGIVVFFMPWLGIPDLWKAYGLTAAGTLLFATGYLLRRAAYLRRIELGNGERGTDSFVESSVASTDDDMDELPEEENEEEL
ncbi:MAG: hypothetical protein WDZ93_00740 [Candidatus Paceibacterota bacterium]